MLLNETDNTYCCMECNRISRIVGSMRDQSDDTGGYSSRRGNFANGQDHSRAQIKQTFEQLLLFNEKYKGVKIPREILLRAATDYNNIQVAKAEKYEQARFGITTDENGVPVVAKQPNPNDDKKFVRRSYARYEILGALIYYGCITAKIPRKKRDIAEFMQLLDEGLSRGEDELKNFHADGIIVLPIDQETTTSYVERYLELLKLDHEERYKFFVIELVKEANRCHIGMNSIDSSKVVGAIWTLVQRIDTTITITDIETKCDGIRKNTFSHFSKAIDANILSFIDVFEKYGIKHGYEGRLKKKLVQG
jgi:hypothetical protein